MKRRELIAFISIGLVVYLICIVNAVLAQDNATETDEVCIPREQFDRYTDAVGKCGEYGRQYAKLRGEIESLQAQVCKIEDRQLLDCYTKMSNHEREYLEVFTRTKEAVDVFQFAMMVNPAAIGVEKTRVELYSNSYLENWNKCGFAKAFCYPVFNERYQVNTTICLYTPVVNDYCLNKTVGLRGIKGTGVLQGALNTGLYGILFIIINFAIVAFFSKSPGMPWR